MSETRPVALGARGLLSAAFMLFVARVAAMVLGLLQAVLLATKSGTSAETDAFFVAYAVCYLFISPTEGSLTIALVPAFVHKAEVESEEMAWRVAAGLFRVGLIGMTGIALLLAASSPWLAPLLAPGFDEATVTLVALFIRVLSPIVVLAFIASYLATMDYVSGHYALPALGLAVNAVAGPVSLLLFADRFGVIALAWGLVAGGLLRCAMLCLGSPQASRLLGPAVPFRDPALGQIGRTMVARVAANWFIELNMMVDRVFASFLGPGYVSCLAYASRAVLALVNVVVMPMGRTLMPTLSRLMAQSQYERLRALLEKLVIAIGFLVLPITAFVAFFRVEILTVLFQRGAFDAGSVDATAYALLFYSLGTLPFLATPVLNATFFALGESGIPLRIGMVCVLANVILDAVLVLGMGHGGIALATSLVGVIRASLLAVYLQRQIGALRWRPVLGSLLTSAAAASFAFWGAQLLVSAGGLQWSQPFWRMATCALAGGAGYVLLQWSLNPQVVRLTWSILGRRKRSIAT